MMSKSRGFNRFVIHDALKKTSVSSVEAIQDDENERLCHRY